LVSWEFLDSSATLIDNLAMVDNQRVHWLPTVCRPGPWQMACDEALLLCAGGDRVPRFRFYSWSEPTISLGYFQDYRNFLSAFPNLSGLTIVRRLTGGGAILHDREITYSLIISADHDLYKKGPIAAYTLVHQAIADCLRALRVELELRPKDPNYARVRDEPEFCFARPCPTDLIHPTGKLVGSAQRRLPEAFLQHGSIILQRRFPDHPTTALEDLVPDPPPPDELEQTFATEIEKKLQLPFQKREFTPAELDRTEQLIPKYAGKDWTVHRQT